MPTPLVQSVIRALGVLDELTAADGRGEGLALSDLARRTGLRPNTLHNLLRSLIAAGYAEAPGGGRYREGPKCRRLGLRNHSGEWAERLTPLLDGLVAKSGESVVFCVLADVERLMIYHRECDHPVRVVNHMGPHRHFFSLATSRVLAAWSAPDAREALVRRWGLPGGAFDNIRSQAALNVALDAIRAAGQARCLSHDGHVVNLAVPALASGGTLLGALGCYLPEFRCKPEGERALLADMRRTAASAGKVLQNVSTNLANSTNGQGERRRSVL